MNTEHSNELAILIYVIGYALAYVILKKSNIQWVHYGDKTKFGMGDAILCLMFSLFSWAGALMGFIMYLIAGGFSNKKPPRFL